MDRVPGMILIGAAGRNVGKTEFACSLIRRFRNRRPIIAVKVTTIAEKAGKCPRGGDGCGVCSSLLTNYFITEETEPPEGKDTDRLLKAGAEKVYWLRVMKEHLHEGFRALMDILPEAATLVVESNSLRLAAEPDLFVMVRDASSIKYKPTAESVRAYADKIMLFNGNGFDTDETIFDLVDGRWSIREPATAVILAGGRSRRMGADKSMLPVAGKPMIQLILEQLRPHFSDVIVSANDPERYAFLGVKTVPDRTPGLGPLMGIASAMDESKTDLNFVIACDMPDVELDMVSRMLVAAHGYDGVVPVGGVDLYEPLFAVYRKVVAATALHFLEGGRRRIIDVFAEHNISFMQLAGAGRNALSNINTPQDYEGLKTRVRE